MTTGQPPRPWLVSAYALLAVAGVAALVWPSPAVVNAGGRGWAAVWGALLVVGGSAAAYGAARRVYRWEYAGLTPLISVWAVYAISSFTLVAAGVVDRLAGALSLTAVACLLTARWRDVAQVRKAARQLWNHEGDQR